MGEVTSGGGGAARWRVGDAERQQAVDRLSEGYQHGRLGLDEFTERSERAWQATWATDLEVLLADLPSTPAPAGAVVPAAATRTGLDRRRDDASSGIPLTLAVMSGADRSGEWTASGTHNAVAIMGGVSIDLREARFTEPETRILAVAIMGGIEVIVPPHVRVRVHGLPLMGGFGAQGAINPDTLAPDAPLVVISGVAVMGGVGVRRLGPDDDA